MSGEYAGRVRRTPIYEYTIYCAGCTEAETIHEPSMKVAEDDFRRGGWRMIVFLWYCPDCAALKEKQA